MTPLTSLSGWKSCVCLSEKITELGQSISTLNKRGLKALEHSHLQPSTSRHHQYWRAGCHCSPSCWRCRFHSTALVTFPKDPWIWSRAKPVIFTPSHPGHINTSGLLLMAEKRGGDSPFPPFILLQPMTHSASKLIQHPRFTWIFSTGCKPIASLPSCQFYHVSIPKCFCCTGGPVRTGWTLILCSPISSPCSVLITYTSGSSLCPITEDSASDSISPLPS